MNGEPDCVQGAWTRQSVAIDGGEPFETQRVVWIQAGVCYADVRVPFHPAATERCFTGRSGWDIDGYRWTHRVDLEVLSPAGDDLGDLSWEDDTLIERGQFPTETGVVSYEERWVRLPDWRGPFLALEGDSTCMVRSGGHAITVADRRADGGAFVAIYRRLCDGEWPPVLTIGPADDLPSPADPPDSWHVVHRGVCA